VANPQRISKSVFNCQDFLLLCCLRTAKSAQPERYFLTNFLKVSGLSSSDIHRTITQGDGICAINIADEVPGPTGEHHA
jgi:hypothetical protein